MRLVAAVLAIVLQTWPVNAGERVALVIGNEAYRQMSRLYNPVRDAGKLAAILTHHGFDVHSCDGSRPGCFDLDAVQIRDALDAFERKAKTADVALVFFSGHGMQSRTGNLLAPTDMAADCDEIRSRRGVLLSDFVSVIERARRKIIILDACRTDPFPQCQGSKGLIPVSFGSFEQLDAQQLMLVSSTKPGQVALDGLEGAHSPFAGALLRALERAPGQYLDQVINAAARTVIEETSEAGFVQIPEMLLRGGAPQICLSAQTCSPDPSAEALKTEIARLAGERARDQDLAEIARAYLASLGVEVRSGGISREEKERVLRSITAAGRALAETQNASTEAALAQMRSGKPDAAIAILKQSLEAKAMAAQATGASPADVAKARGEASAVARHLANLVRAVDLKEATAFVRRALSFEADSFDNHVLLADLLREAGDLASAQQAAQAAIKAARDDAAARIRALNLASDVAKQAGDADAALAAVRESIATGERRIAQDPAAREIRYGTLLAEVRLGDLLRDLGDIPGATGRYRQTMAYAEALTSADPGSPVWQRGLSIAHNRLGDIAMDEGRLGEAIEAYRADLRIATRLSLADPANTDAARDLAITREQLGDALRQSGEFAPARDQFEAAATVRRALVQADPANPTWQRELAANLDRLGDISLIGNDVAAAQDRFTASLAILSKVAGQSPDDLDLQRDLMIARSRMGDLALKRGDLQEAIAFYRQETAIAEMLVRRNPANASWRRDLALALGRAADAGARVPGGQQQALADLAQGMEILKALSAASPGDAGVAGDVVWFETRMREVERSPR